jgi:hypothetical protein
VTRSVQPKKGRRYGDLHDKSTCEFAAFRGTDILLVVWFCSSTNAASVTGQVCIGRPAASCRAREKCRPDGYHKGELTILGIGLIKLL